MQSIYTSSISRPTNFLSFLLRFRFQLLSPFVAHFSQLFPAFSVKISFPFCTLMLFICWFSVDFVLFFSYAICSVWIKYNVDNDNSSAIHQSWNNQCMEHHIISDGFGNTMWTHFINLISFFLLSCLKYSTISIQLKRYLLTLKWKTKHFFQYVKWEAVENCVWPFSGTKTFLSVKFVYRHVDLATFFSLWLSMICELCWYLYSTNVLDYSHRIAVHCCAILLFDLSKLFICLFFFFFFVLLFFVRHLPAPVVIFSFTIWNTYAFNSYRVLNFRLWNWPNLAERLENV